MPDASARTPYVAGNLKMHMTVAATRAYVDKLLGRLPLGKGVEVGLCAPFTALPCGLDRVSVNAEAAAPAALAVSGMAMVLLDWPAEKLSVPLTAV